jgi:hypothetical protein
VLYGAHYSSHQHPSYAKAADGYVLYPRGEEEGHASKGVLSLLFLGERKLKCENTLSCNARCHAKSFKALWVTRVIRNVCSEARYYGFPDLSPKKAGLKRVP